jgi:hypothetical protein
MPNPATFPATTAICLFHTPSRAQRAVQQLLDLGIPHTDIAVVGDAPSELLGTPTATLQSMRIPDEDIEVLMEGLEDGGAIVAVRSSAEFSERIDRIFKQQSAEMVDKKEFETNAEPAALPTDHFVNPRSVHFDTSEPNRLDGFAHGEEPDTEEPLDLIDPPNRP